MPNLNDFISNKTMIIIGLIVLCFVYPEDSKMVIGGLLGFLTDNLMDSKTPKIENVKLISRKGDDDDDEE